MVDSVVLKSLFIVIMLLVVLCGNIILLRRLRSSGKLEKSLRRMIKLLVISGFLSDAINLVSLLISTSSGVVDADYKFLWVNVGARGSMSDAGVFNGSSLNCKIEEGALGLPNPDPLPNDDQDTPYFFVGDTFALRPNMIKPYSHRHLAHGERIFNYRTSRARRVVENDFGIMGSRFRCLMTTLNVTSMTAVLITRACVILHQIMRLRYPGLQNEDLDQEDASGNIVPCAWRNGAMMAEVEEVQRCPRENQHGKLLRTQPKFYYNSRAGSVSWQEEALNFNY